MEKDRERLSTQIRALEREIEDLKDQNVQLQYKLEYTTEPMLMEQLQDVTDMRDALTNVKVQLEREISEKDALLAERQAALDAKARELQQLEHELHEVECERDELEQRVADATKAAEADAKAQYESQLQAKAASVAELTTEVTALESELDAKQQQLEALEVERAVAAQQHHDQLAQARDDLAAAEQRHAEALDALQTSLDDAIQSKEQALTELKATHRALTDTLEQRIASLETQVRESETALSDLTHENEDYKEDCALLWKTNEDLKQQLALASAETMLRDAEMRETALSDQSALLEKVHELECQLQAAHEQLHEKTQEVATVQADAVRAAAKRAAAVDEYVATVVCWAARLTDRETNTVLCE